MNFLIRVKSILVEPTVEFPKLREETIDIVQLYKSYLVLIAALPALGTLLGGSQFLSFGLRFKYAIVGYLITLGSFYVSALIIDALAPRFDSTKNVTNALKLVGYASTPLMMGRFLAFLPGIGWILSLAGLLYSIYQFYLGLPVFMDTPREKTVSFMVVSFLVSLAVYAVLGFVLLPFFGLTMIWR